MAVEWVPIAVALVGGSALTKVIDVIYDRAKGATERRRGEVDRIAKQLKDAERRERIAVEWGHRNAVAAIRAGVLERDMPVLDFQDGSEGR